jgi:hypothetical protein
MNGKAATGPMEGFRNSQDEGLTHSSFHTALVVEGGALRGVFSTGLLDGFLSGVTQKSTVAR